MTRIPLDHLTSDQLDTLYERLDKAERAVTCWKTRARIRAQQRSKTEQRAERAEATLNAVRALHSRWECDANSCAVCVDGYGTPLPYPCPTIRVLNQHGQTPS